MLKRRGCDSLGLLGCRLSCCERIDGDGVWAIAALPGLQVGLVATEVLEIFAGGRPHADIECDVGGVGRGARTVPVRPELLLKIRIEALEHRSAIVCTAACASSAHVVGHDPAMKFDAR